MVIENELILNQKIWDSTPEDVKAIFKKTHKVTILSNEEWDKLGKMMVARAWELKRLKDGTPCHLDSEYGLTTNTKREKDGSQSPTDGNTVDGQNT